VVNNVETCRLKLIELEDEIGNLEDGLTPTLQTLKSFLQKFISALVFAVTHLRFPLLTFPSLTD
jgi:hypothetical protein